MPFRYLLKGHYNIISKFCEPTQQQWKATDHFSPIH